MNSVERKRRFRRRCKSQSLIEFALVLPIYLTFMMGVFDYGWMIGNSMILCQVAREGGVTTSRQTTDPLGRGLEVIVEGTFPRLDMNSASGGAVIQLITFDSAVTANFNLLFHYKDPIEIAPDRSCTNTGLLFGGGDELMNNSKIVPNFTNAAATNPIYWRNLLRRTPFPPDNVNKGQKLVVVEVWYTNDFVTPIGVLIGLTAPAFLYDAGYF